VPFPANFQFLKIVNNYNMAQDNSKNITNSGTYSGAMVDGNSCIERDSLRIQNRGSTINDSNPFLEKAPKPKAFENQSGGTPPVYRPSNASLPEQHRGRKHSGAQIRQQEHGDRNSPTPMPQQRQYEDCNTGKEQVYGAYSAAYKLTSYS